PRALDGGHGSAPAGDHRGSVAAHVLAPADEPDLGADAGTAQVAREHEPVAAVVALAAADDHRAARLAPARTQDARRPCSRALHQDRAGRVVVDGPAVHRPHLGGRDDDHAPARRVMERSFRAGSPRASVRRRRNAPMPRTAATTSAVSPLTAAPRRKAGGSYQNRTRCRPASIATPRNSALARWIERSVPSTVTRHPGQYISDRTRRPAAVASTSSTTTSLSSRSNRTLPASGPSVPTGIGSTGRSTTAVRRGSNDGDCTAANASTSVETTSTC